MRIMENIRMALKALKGNLLRASLTILIIAFGIMALVGILTAIDSILFSMSDSFSSLGANSFSIHPADTEIRSRSSGKVNKRAEPISYDEALRFKEKYPASGNVTISLQAKSRVAAKYADKETNPTLSIVGVDENQLGLYGQSIEDGRYFSPSELRYGNPVAVVGNRVVSNLFDGEAGKSIDEPITVDGKRFRIVGTIASEGASMNQNADAQIYIPLLKAKQLYGSSKSNYKIAVGVPSSEMFTEATSEAIGVMRVARGLRPEAENDFEIRKSDDLIKRIKENTVKIRLGTIAIGIMTIIGAAIGLMNIMLVSVTERTREIGIIKAIGATRNHIFTQFLTEAVVICMIGGVLGIVLGIFMGNIVTWFIGGSFIIPWMWMSMALGICIVVGLVSGMFPAIKASKLDPIEALRHE